MVFVLTLGTHHAASNIQICLTRFTRSSAGADERVNK